MTGSQASRPRALVLRALGLGDLLAAVPALRGLRTVLPRHQIVLATPAALEPLAALTGAIDAVLPASGLAPLAWPGEPPDLAVNLHGRGPQSHRCLAATGASRVIGFGNTEAAASGPEWRADEHEVCRWCRLVDALLDGTVGARCDPADLDLAVPAVPAPAHGAAVVHPGAGYPARRWPPERFASVARALAARGLPVAVSGTAAEAGLAAEVADAAGLGGSAVLAGRTGTAELAALIAAAAVVISGDTGVAHLATAYRRPSVVLFGPVPPALWGPPARPQHVALWYGDGPGDPQGQRLDPALDRIGVADVLDAVERVLPSVPAA